MDSQSNNAPRDSLHTKQLKDPGSLEPHRGHTSLVNQADFEIAEEVVDHNDKPLIHNLRSTQRNQADTNPLGIRPQEIELIQEQEQEEVKKARAQPKEEEPEESEEEEELIAEIRTKDFPQ